MSRALAALLRKGSAPDEGLAWLVVAGAFAIYCATVGLQYNLGLLLTAVINDEAFSRGYSLGALSTIASLSSAAYLSLSLPAGFFVERFGVRAAALAGAAVLGAGFCGAAAAPSVPALVAAFGLIGGGVALPSVAAVVHVSRAFSARRATATGLAVSGSGVGAAVVAPLLQAAIDARGWRAAALLVGAGCASVVVAAAALLIPIAAPGALRAPGVPPAAPAACDGAVEWYGAGYSAGGGGGGDRGDGGGGSSGGDGGGVSGGDGAGGGGSGDGTLGAFAGAGAAASPPPHAAAGAPGDDEAEGARIVPGAAGAARLGVRGLLRDKAFRTYLFVIVLWGAAWFVLLTHFNKASREGGVRASDAALLVTLQGAANAAGRVVLGLSADGCGARAMPKLVMLQLCFVGVALGTAALAAPAVMSSFPAQALFMILMGGLGGSCAALQAPTAVDLVGLNNVALAFSLINAAQGPFVLAAPPLGGALRDATGSYGAVWLLTAADIFAATALLASVVPPAGVGRPVTLAACARGRAAVG